MILLNLTSLALAAMTGTAPNPVARASQQAVADSAPVLTVDALTRMTTFWARFMKESPAIRDTGRAQNQKQVTLILDLGSEGPQNAPSTVVNMVAMAAKYPSVATDLQQAGLTAPQWEQYRDALLTASMTAQAAKANDVSPTPNSVVAQNIAFLNAHPKELDALKATGMWFPKLQTGASGDLAP